MATIQEQLQAEIDKIKADTLLLHDLVHGADTATVTTDNGVVGSVAKQLKDKLDTLDTAVQEALTAFNLTEEELGETLSKTQDTLNRANTVVNEAEGYLNTTRSEIQEFVADAKSYVTAAEGHATTAQTAASSVRSLEATYGLSLPGTLTGRGGFVIAVNEEETGYEFTGTIVEFSGVRRSGSRLVFEQGVGNYTTKDLGFWVLTAPGVGVETNSDGELIITF